MYKRHRCNSALTFRPFRTHHTLCRTTIDYYRIKDLRPIDLKTEREDFRELCARKCLTKTSADWCKDTAKDTPKARKDIPHSGVEATYIVVPSDE